MCEVVSDDDDDDAGSGAGEAAIQHQSAAAAVSSQPGAVQSSLSLSMTQRGRLSSLRAPPQATTAA